MKESTLEENASGQKYLVCYYSKDRCDWNKAIDLALNRHGLKHGDGVTILCLPIKEKSG